MKNSKMWWIIGAVAIIAGFIIYNYYYQRSAPQNPKVEALAQCLKDKGVKMYGAYWCPHCIRQKELFGTSWKHITYVECAVPGDRGQNALCQQAGIQGYPTWDFGEGKRASGQLSFKELSEQSGCNYSN